MKQNLHDHKLDQSTLLELKNESDAHKITTAYYLQPLTNLLAHEEHYSVCSNASVLT